MAGVDHLLINLPDHSGDRHLRVHLAGKISNHDQVLMRNDGIDDGLDGIDRRSCQPAAEQRADEWDSSDDSAESSKCLAGDAAQAPAEGPLKPGKEKAPYEKGLFPLVAAQNDA